MWKPFTIFTRTLTGVLTLFGIFWLPKDAQDMGQAAQPWLRFAAMIDQTTALWALVVVLIGMIAWSDGRRFVEYRRGQKTENRIKAFLAGRSRITLRDAACIAVGIAPADYENSPEAKSEASVMLYYARTGLIRLANLTDSQWEQLKRGDKIKGVDPESFDIESVIEREELDTYMGNGWKNGWLVVLDNMRRQRA